MPVKYDVIKCPRDMGEAINDAINMAFDELRKEYIPIEWLKKKYGWLTMTGEIIKDWEKENAKND